MLPLLEDVVLIHLIGTFDLALPDDLFCGYIANLLPIYDHPPSDMRSHVVTDLL